MQFCLHLARQIPLWVLSVNDRDTYMYVHVLWYIVIVIQNDNTLLLFTIHIQLKSLGPIDRKFHGHGENDGFVLYEHIIKQFSSF